MALCLASVQESGRVQGMKMNAPLNAASDAKLYEQVADRVVALIDQGTLRTGDRIPSVRKMHEQLSVSVSTVLEAYRQLEARAIIEARPQSGYFVRSRASETVREPGPSSPPRRANTVEVRSLATRLRQALSKPDMIRLGAAVPGAAFLPLSRFNRSLSRVTRWHPEAVHDFDPPPGLLKLRQQIARRMMNAGCALSPDDILTTAGATEALQISLRAVTKPGDVVAVESPTYYCLLETLEALNLRAVELCTCPRTGVTADDIDTVIKQRRIAAVVLIANFSNPLGSCIPDDEKRRIVELLEAQDVPLIEDDVYGELPHDGQRPKALKAFDRTGNVLYCNSFSKTISPGLRVGWCAAGRFSEQVEQLRVTSSQATATLPQVAMADYLASGGYDVYLRRVRRLYREQAGRFIDAVAAFFPKGTRVTKPVGGHVIWIEMPEGCDSLKLHEAACEHHISIAPGPLFTSGQGYLNCLRLNAGIAWDQRVEAAIDTLGQLAARQLESGADATPQIHRRARRRKAVVG